jgi:hypothetical protein
MADQISFRDAEGLIAARAMKDPAFRQEFLGNPKATIEKYSGQKMPADVKVFAHEITAKEVHFVIPAPPPASTELSDADLEKVAGGEFIVTWGVVTAVATAVFTAGVSVANDQTRARSGW